MIFLRIIEALLMLAGLFLVIGSVVLWIRALAEEDNGTWEKVTYCRDCKYYNHIGCAIAIADESDKPTDYDFCSFGEEVTKME